MGYITTNVSAHEKMQVLWYWLEPFHSISLRLVSTIFTRLFGFVGIFKRGIKLLKIGIVEQIGDLFTRSFPKTTFECLNKKIMGW